MCLFVHYRKTLKLRKSGKQFITGYKIVDKRNDNCLYSMFFSHKWAIGFNNAYVKIENHYNEKYNKLCIDNGIHVFLYKPNRHDFMEPYEKIIPVRCYLNDLIAVGRHGDAVFRRVYLSKQSYDKAIKC